MTPEPRRFLITGVSSGLGRAFALEALRLGHSVIGTVRTIGSPLGIHVTAIEPGPFRTDWSGRSMVHSPRTVHDCDESYEPIREARAQYNGRQPGDPEKGAQAVLRAIEADKPPRHLLLGAAAIEALAASRAALDEDVARWEVVTRSTDFPPADVLE